MLFKMSTLGEIFEGKIDLAFRRWLRPTVKTGGTLNTPRGVLRIVSVEAVPDVSDEEARRAGHGDRDGQLAALAPYGILFRIRGIAVLASQV